MGVPVLTREYEFVIRVRLPDGMTPEAFLADTRVEWAKGGHRDTRGALVYRYGEALDVMPEWISEKQLRAVA